MAGHKLIPFYEAPLPQPLPKDRSWLLDYHNYTKQLIDYLKAHGVSDSRFLSTIHCLSDLRDYLIQKGLSYSESNASDWYDSLKLKRTNGYLITLSRLSDLYRYGEIHPINAYPNSRPYAELLNNPWDYLLQDYLDTQNLHGKNRQRVKHQISRFLFWIQSKHIQKPSSITYMFLQSYLEQDAHKSEKEKSRYTFVVGNFIIFLADKGLCHHALGWYPYYWMKNRIINSCDLTRKQKQTLLAIKKECSSDSLEDIYKHCCLFLTEFLKSGYNESMCEMATFTIRNLFLFLDMYGVGYIKEAVDIWLDHLKAIYQENACNKFQRVLKLLDTYLQERKLRPDIYFTNRIRLYDSIPTWCKTETDAFLNQKKKEGWAPSTVNGASACIARFCRYLDDHDISDLSAITPEILKSFNLSDEFSTIKNKNSYNGIIRKFLQCLERKGTLPYGRHLALSCASVPHEHIVTILTSEEKESIYKKHSYSSTPIELRDKAMIMLGINMGLRACDVVTILLTDIDWKRRTIRIIQKKTNHEILLPVPVCVGNAIYEYIKNGRPNNKTTSKYLFVKTKMPYGSVKKGVCLDALKRTLPDRNVPGSGFHVTRKTYATDRLRNGASRQGIADLLGHKDTHSLKSYLQFDSSNMRLCPISLAESGLSMKGDRYDRV